MVAWALRGDDGWLVGSRCLTDVVVFALLFSPNNVCRVLKHK
jgi:hypothetical protein